MSNYLEVPNQLRAIADALNSTSIGITARGVKVLYAAELIERLTAELAAAKAELAERYTSKASGKRRAPVCGIYEAGIGIQRCGISKD